jgi:hypothetical protein
MLAGGVLLVASLHLATSPARAECDGPYPPFREAAATADRIVYGEVVDAQPVDWGVGDGLTSRFAVQGWSLLGGARPDRVEVMDLVSQPCAGYLVARLGDWVAIAFEGRAFSTNVEVNAITWIAGRPPDRDGLESMTEWELFALPGVDPPPAADPPAPGYGLGWLGVAALLGVLAGSVLVLRRLVAGDDG